MQAAEAVMSATTETKNILAELERLQGQNKGILQARAVVDAAAPSDSPLHPKFEWDDAKAGDEYRLWQARELIRSFVAYPDDESESVPIFVSLSSDRKLEDGGYRAMVDVLNDDELRAQLLADALTELRTFERKYRTLKELGPVFKAFSRVEMKTRK